MASLPLPVVENAAEDSFELSPSPVKPKPGLEHEHSSAVPERELKGAGADASPEREMKEAGALKPVSPTLNADWRQAEIETVKDDDDKAPLLSLVSTETRSTCA